MAKDWRAVPGAVFSLVIEHGNEILRSCGGTYRNSLLEPCGQYIEVVFVRADMFESEERCLQVQALPSSSLTHLRTQYSYSGISLF